MAKLTDRQISRLYELADSGLSTREIAPQIPCNQGTVTRALQRRKAGERFKGDGYPKETNVPVDSRGAAGGDTSIVTPDRPLTLEEMYDLFKIDRSVWLPVHITANQWQGFYKVKADKGHRKVALWQTKVSWRRIMDEHLQEMLVRFMRENVKPLPKPGRMGRPPGDAPGHMVAWGLWDAHLGMHAWDAEVGESFDLKTAVSRVTNSIDDMVNRLAWWPHEIEQIVMPIGNDYMHYDNVREKTTYGEHHLDADGRYAKVYVAGLQCLIYMVERALEVAPKVKILYIPGNHDLTTAYTLTVALAQRFLNDKRVEVDMRANPRKYVKFGGTLLGFDHGDKAKPDALVRAMLGECAADIGTATYREIQVGHTHQRMVKDHHTLIPTNGVTIRVNPALCNTDVWHHKQGFIGEPMKSVEAWFYSRTGYEGSLVTWARDEKNNRARSIPLCHKTA